MAAGPAVRAFAAAGQARHSRDDEQLACNVKNNGARLHQRLDDWCTAPPRLRSNPFTFYALIGAIYLAITIIDGGLSGCGASSLQGRQNGGGSMISCDIVLDSLPAFEVKQAQGGVYCQRNFMFDVMKRVECF